jgi:pimeloyl-ACP methyl ester carboxylesterase
MRQLARRIFFAIGMFLIASRPVNADESERMLPIDHSVAEVTHYRSTTVDGVKIFYREAGPSDGPVVLLLHGFPTSSYMFRRLIPALADRYHVIAPDYPGFGASDTPDPSTFKYTFAHYAELINEFLEQKGVKRFATYCFDYGAPVSYRLALLHPGRISALIVQNGNAYDEGLQSFWDPMRVYWADGSRNHRQALSMILGPEAIKAQYTYGVKDLTRLDPDTWEHDQGLIDRPGNGEIQLDLFYDYRTNVALYPEFQKFFRKYQPPTLIVWGKNDQVFPTSGAKPYLRDLPNAEYHELETGHFVLEDQFDVAEPLIHRFLDKNLFKAS